MTQTAIFPEELITLTDAAELIGITREWLYTLIERGELTPVPIAGRRYFHRSEVEALKAKRNGG